MGFHPRAEALTASPRAERAEQAGEGRALAGSRSPPGQSAAGSAVRPVATGGRGGAQNRAGRAEGQIHRENGTRCAEHSWRCVLKARESSRKSSSQGAL